MEQANIGKNVKKLMMENGVTLEKMSREMNVKKDDLLSKLEGKKEFCVSDILSITKLLNLTNEQVSYTFFNF